MGNGPAWLTILEVLVTRRSNLRRVDNIIAIGFEKLAVDDRPSHMNNDGAGDK